MRAQDDHRPGPAVDPGEVEAAALTEALAEGLLVEEARDRLDRRLARRDLLASAATSGGFAVAAAICAVWLPGSLSTDVALAAVLTTLLAIASRVEFEVGPGSVVPTQLALVPMLLLLPPRLVPLFVAAAYLAAGTAHQLVRRQLRVDRLMLYLASSWHAIGPAVVLAFWAPEELTAGALPVYVTAFVAQIACDAASALLRNCAGLGIDPRSLAGPLAWVVTIDLLLSPIGFLAALSGDENRFAVVLASSLVALLALLAVDRRRTLDRQLTLSRAFADANQEARNDPLTGVANRLAWDEALALASHRVRAGGSASLVLVDLNGLKRANDTRGHDFGDRMIRAVASVLFDVVEDRGLVARIGGDEFGVLLPDVSEYQIVEIVARIERAFELHPGIDGFPLSASLGSASSPPCRDLSEAIGAADAALYRQKSLSALTRDAA